MSGMDWYPSVTDYTEDEYDECFGSISDSLKIESHGPFNMHEDYVEYNIFQYNIIYYFDSDTYDEEYYSTIDCFVHNVDTI